MTREEFHKYLNTQDIESKIVYMRYKYLWEDEWTYTNEILEVDISVDGYYIWNNDWDEGQEEVEILGCISVSDIDIPEFETKKAMSDLISRQAAIEAIESNYRKIGLSHNNGAELEQIIKSLPSENRPTGEWVKAVNDGVWSYTDAYARCDQCHKVKFNGWGMNYCPNCGAKMEV